MFRFSTESRSIVAGIVTALEYANSHKSLSSQRGCYGHLENALRSIIEAECGKQVVEFIDNSSNHYNFGGNESWLIDVEVAIDNAQTEIAEQTIRAIETTVDPVVEDAGVHTQSEVLAMAGEFGSVDREGLLMAMVYVVDSGMSDSHAIDAAIELHPKADRKKLEKLLPLWG